MRKLGLYDRVELPGAVADMRGEWAKASISRPHLARRGLPAVGAGGDGGRRARRQLRLRLRTRARSSSTSVNGLLVSPDSIAGMAAALLRLATDADLRRHLGEGAYRTSRQYDAYAIAERWVGIFGEARTARTTAGRLTPRVTALAEAKPVATSADARRGRRGGHSRGGPRGHARLGRPRARPRAATTGSSSPPTRAAARWWCCRWPTGTPS